MAAGASTAGSGADSGSGSTLPAETGDAVEVAGNPLRGQIAAGARKVGRATLAPPGLAGAVNQAWARKLLVTRVLLET